MDKYKILLTDFLSQYSMTPKGESLLVNPCPLCGHKNHFYIFPNSNRYYSFGCGHKGDIGDFLVAYLNITNNEAMSMLDDGGNINKKHHRVDFKVKVEKLFDYVILMAKNAVYLAEKMNDQFASNCLFFIGDYFTSTFWRMINLRYKKQEEYYKMLITCLKDLKLDLGLALIDYIRFLKEFENEK